MSPTTSSEIKPFVIDLDEDLLSDLQDRLAKTRMPVYPADGSWSAGTDPDYLKELLNFWQHSFDWRKQEVKLNQFSHFKTEIADIDIHYIHHGPCAESRIRCENSVAPDQLLGNKAKQIK
jgi:hypothetical protein